MHICSRHLAQITPALRREHRRKLTVPVTLILWSPLCKNGLGEKHPKWSLKVWILLEGEEQD
jgi:hypothetical protein